MELGNVQKILKAAGYSAEQAKGVAELFTRLSIKTLDDLDNAPRVLGPAVLGISSYRLVKVVREGTLNPPVEKKAQKAEPEKKEEKVEEPQEETNKELSKDG